MMLILKISIGLTAIFGLTSGQVPGSEYDKLMCVGGYGDGLDNEYEVEIIDVSGQNMSCPEMANGPVNTYAVGTFINDRAMVCNGNDAWNKCHIYNEVNKTWYEGTSTIYRVTERAAVSFTSDLWWITGGDTTDLTEMYHGSNDTFGPYISLPEPNYRHQMIPVNETHAVYIGHYGAKTVHMFDRTSLKWTELPELPEYRDGPLGGLAKFPDGKWKIVVAGGASERSVVILDLETMIWMPAGHNLVYDITSASVVHYQDSFLLVGGWSNNIETLDDEGKSIFETELQSIYYFDAVQEKFIRLDQTLKSKKKNMACFMVPQWYTECV